MFLTLTPFLELHLSVKDLYHGAVFSTQQKLVYFINYTIHAIIEIMNLVFGQSISCHIHNMKIQETTQEIPRQMPQLHWCHTFQPPCTLIQWSFGNPPWHKLTKLCLSVWESIKKQLQNIYNWPYSGPWVCSAIWCNYIVWLSFARLHALFFNISINCLSEGVQHATVFFYSITLG